MMKMSKLIKTGYAMKVKDAIESGELSHDNVYDWTTAYNGGFADQLLRDEAHALIKYFTNDNWW